MNENLPTSRALTKIELKPTESVDRVWEIVQPARPPAPVVLRPRGTYREMFGDEPLQVGIVEFRIMLFLSSRPYHAFTRRQICDAVSTEDQPVTEETVDLFASSLRDQLGAFHDFIQVVPQVGYRFKA
jgi:DNA-binding winged helix-turn-helix (wHTH) protein